MRDSTGTRVLSTLALLSALLAVAPLAGADDPPASPPPPTPPAPAPVTPPTPPPEVFENLPDITVTAPRIETPLRVSMPIPEIPRAVDLVPSERLKERVVPSALDALDDRVGIWIEKRTGHTSDPVMRGLSGGNLLALVDGNTLSTFWGEGGFAGDDMYGKIDPEMLDHVEVVRGPASVLYGSNALGGVINFVTRRSPFDFTECGVVYGSRTRFSGATATGALRGRFETYGASPSLRWLVGGTWWETGDAVDGSGEVQDPSRGEGNFQNAALDVRLSRRATLDITYQRTDNEPIYRFYRPTQDNANRRDAVAATLDLTHLSDVVRFADSARVKVYYQDKEDRRRWFNSSGVLTQTGVARWETVHAGVQFDKALCRHHLTYGVDVESTWAESPDDEQFTITTSAGVKTKASPDTIWSSFGAYVQDVWEATPCLTVTASARVDVFRFESQVDGLYDPPGSLDPQEDEFTDWETALVGGLQATWKASDRTRVYGGWSRGFRQFAPKFGATQHGYGVVVPSQLLDPVTADQFEIGVRHDARVWKGELVAYHTIFRNFQNIVRGTFEGQDWFDYDGDTIRDTNEDVYVTSGNGEAYVQGVEATASVDLGCLTGRAAGWSLGAGFAWNYGADETNDIPLRHTHPTFGTLKLRYDDPCPERGLWLEVAGKFVRRYDRIPPDRLANDVGYLEDPQDSASGKRRSWGLPGYSVMDIRGGLNIGEHATLVLGVENVFDTLYRPAHARWDAPGTSFVIALEMTF